MSEQLSPVSHEQIMKLLLAFGMHLKETQDEEIKEIENRHKAEIDKLKDEIVSLKEKTTTNEVSDVNTNTMNEKGNRKAVLAEFSADMCFKIPDELDLNDESVVKWWEVKWGRLHINYVDEKLNLRNHLTCIIPDYDGSEDYDIFKRPNSLKIVDADDVCVDYDDSEDEEEEEIDEREYDFEPEIEREESDILEGIKCVDCGRILPPHTKMEHLDFSHPIHECPHRVF